MGSPFPPNCHVGTARRRVVRHDPMVTGVRGIHPTVAVPFQNGRQRARQDRGLLEVEERDGFCHVVSAVTA